MSRDSATKALCTDHRAEIREARKTEERQVEGRGQNEEFHWVGVPGEVR